MKYARTLFVNNRRPMNFHICSINSLRRINEKHRKWPGVYFLPPVQCTVQYKLPVVAAAANVVAAVAVVAVVVVVVVAYAAEDAKGNPETNRLDLFDVHVVI